MKFMSFLGGEFKRNLSGGRKSPISKFKWTVLLSIFFLVSWQGASASAKWEDGCEQDVIKWDPDQGSIYYKVRVFQTWGGASNGYSGWANPDSALRLIQHTAVPHEISILLNEDGTSQNQTFIDGRELGFKLVDERVTVDGKERILRFLEFYVPVSQEDLGQEVSVDLCGIWWRQGDNDQNINKPSYRKFTLDNPKGPGLEITKVYYGCSNEGNPMIYFDWTRKDTTGLNAYGIVSLCEADSSSCTSIQGKTYQSANGKAPFSVVAYTSPYHDLNKSCGYKIIQEVEVNVKKNGIESILKYVYESNKVVVNAYPQVSKIDCKLKGDSLVCGWKIDVAPTENYDDGSFLLTIKKTVEDSVSESVKEIEYVAGVTDYSYTMPTNKESAKYEFSVVRSSTKELSCYDIYKKSATANIVAGALAYPKNPRAELYSYPSDVKISWEKEGVVWKNGTLFILRRTNLATPEVSDDTLTKADFEALSYIDKAEPCSSYSYELIYKPFGDGEIRELEIEEDVVTLGCEGEGPLLLTILDGANGKTNIQLSESKTLKFRFVPDEEWKIGSVSFNGEDVTDQLQENVFEVPNMVKNSILSVVYKKIVASPAPRISNVSVRVWTNEGQLIVRNASLGSDVTITDMMGSVVYSGKVDSGEMTIDSIGSGVFLVSVDGEVFKVSL